MYNWQMKLSLQEVEHIAALARLSLTDEEKETYRQQLSAILDHVASLQELDTSDVPATSSVLDVHCPLREDEAGEGLAPDQVLLNAPLEQKGQFRVPPVME